jgi:hypothetical protein
VSSTLRTARKEIAKLCRRFRRFPAPGARKRNRSLLKRVRAGRVRALTGAGDRDSLPVFSVPHDVIVDQITVYVVLDLPAQGRHGICVKLTTLGTTTSSRKNRGTSTSNMTRVVGPSPPFGRCGDLGARSRTPNDSRHFSLMVKCLKTSFSIFQVPTKSFSTTKASPAFTVAGLPPSGVMTISPSIMWTNSGAE